MLGEFQTVNAVYPELRNLLPVFVEAYEVVGIVIPEQGIWGDGIDFPAVSMHALLGGRVIEVAEGDLFPFRDGGLDTVYADVDAFVDGFYAAVNVQMPFQQCGVSGSDKGRQPLDQLLAFSRRDEPRRLRRIDEELMLALYMSFIDDESHRRLFEKIYIEYRDPMFFMARSVLGNDSDAEDIVHDVFLKIAKKHMARISRIKNDTDLRNYLLTATKHTALDHLRKHRRERISADAEIEANTPDTIVLTNDAFVEKICNNIEYERILSAIVSMKDIYKEVMPCIP